MKIVRYQVAEEINYGVLEDNRIRQVQDDVFADNFVQGQPIPRSRVKLLCPCLPSKIVAVGLNYRDHAAEMGRAIPEEPILFLKPSTAALPHEGEIVYPAMAGRVDYEAELAIVIGKKATHIRPDQAADHILGYTCFNDVTARDLQFKDIQYTRSKGFDTFAPFGPWIVTDLDPADIKIESFQNGEKRQSSSTKNMIFSPAELVSHISQVMSLLPGDLISTGTPGGIGPLQPGDVIEVVIEGIGRLKNTVVKRESDQ